MIKKNNTSLKALGSEQFCKGVFQNYLKEHLIDANWEPYPNGENSPPDFNLTLNSKVYAVEVTETEILRESRGDKVLEKTFRKSRERFVKKIKVEALNLGILKGTYVVFFLMPWTIPLERKLKKYLRNHLLQYIDKSKYEEQSGPLKIIYEHKNVCQIFKINSTSNRVTHSFANGAWSNSQENQDFVCQLLQNAISSKKQLLEKKSVPPPRILLLLNTYSFATFTLYKNCIPNINFLEFFHSVFLVNPSKEGFFLYTCDKEWKRLFNVQ